MTSQQDTAGRLVLQNGLVLTMDPGLGDFTRADVLVEGSKILAVGPDLPSEARIIDCSGKIVIPGFVNSHQHMFQTALRGYWADALSDDYFSQSRNGDKALFHVYSPEDVYWGQYAGALEQINAGTTTVVDTSQCTETPEHTDAAVDALEASNVRCVYAYSPKAHGSTPHRSYAYPADVRRLRASYFSSDNQLVTLALGSPVDEANWRLARELGLPIFSHVNDETAGLQLEKLAALGLAGPWNTYIHCTGLAQSTWRIIAKTGGRVSLSNLVEQTLCTGLPGLQAALDHGVQPSLSTDAVSLGPPDFFSQLRASYALQRSRLQERQIAGEAVTSPYLNTRDLLRMTTVEGARAAHLDDRTGSLAPGKEADIVVLNPLMINAAPLNHVTGAIVMMMDTSNVETVIIGGQVVKQAGQLVGIDIPTVIRALQDSVAGLLSRSVSPNVLFTSCRS